MAQQFINPDSTVSNSWEVVDPGGGSPTAHSVCADSSNATRIRVNAQNKVCRFIADLSGLRVSINTSPEDPDGSSYATATKIQIEVNTVDASSGYGNDVMGVASANIEKVSGVATANVEKVIGV